MGSLGARVEESGFEFGAAQIKVNTYDKPENVK